MERITKGMGIGAYLDGVISETLKTNLHHKALEEKEKQVSFSSKNSKSGGDSGSQSSDSGGDNDHDGDDEKRDFDSMDDDKSKTMSGDEESLKDEPKVDDVIDKLNSLRSGKSFKDTIVKQRFEEYFNSLSKAEKTAMYAFFKGTAQIVTGDVSGEQATDPEDDADVTMHKGPHVQKKQVKPNVIKKPLPSPEQKSAPKSGAEDTSAPIQVKKK